jgi:hypothetical protein
VYGRAVRTRAAWAIAVVTACLAWAAPAGAAPQVEGTLQVTETTATTVSFTVTGKRTCVTDEQCDYYSDLEEFDGDAPCPTDYPTDGWNSWNGAVLNAGPSTETGTITPRHWLSKDAAVGPSRLCLYLYADRVYYLVAGALITRPALPGGSAGGSGADPAASTGTGGAGTTKAPGVSGSSSPQTAGGKTPAKLTCATYVYQQRSQQALDANRSLAAQLDQNHNGVACQGLPKRKTYVRTVAVAKSASAVRATLGAIYGRAFTQGTGFRSRCGHVSRTRVRCAVAWHRKGTWAGYVDVMGVIRGNEQKLLTQVHVRRP